MRRPISWTERLDDGVKKEYQVSFQGAKVRWKAKRADQDRWEYDFPATQEEWQALLGHAEAKYRRNRIPFSIIETIKKQMS